eukprot:jgi/Galph1/109/GphlegSOOS_G4830.1
MAFLSSLPWSFRYSFYSRSKQISALTGQATFFPRNSPKNLSYGLHVCSSCASKEYKSTSGTLHPSVVVLGGGFGGLYSALLLSQMSWTRLTRPRITLVDRNEHFVFLPLLYEVVLGQLEPWEVAPAYSDLLKGTDIEFFQANIEGIDLEGRLTEVFSTKVGEKKIPYDRLIVAVGSESNLGAVSGAEKYAVPFRSLKDAATVKDRLDEIRRKILHNKRKPSIFVIGGSYSGVELASCVAEFLDGKARVCIVDSGKRLLSASSEHNRIVSQNILHALNVEMILEKQVVDVGQNSLTLRSAKEPFHEEKFDSDLVLWTAGLKASSLLQRVPLPKDTVGRIGTTKTLQVENNDEIFALGDAASVIDINGQVCKATAQAALQEAEYVAWNTWASLTNKKMIPFRYQHLGELLTLGKYRASAEIFGIPLSGATAQLTRRLAYLIRMPTAAHRLRVGQNWALKPLNSLLESLSLGL